MADSLRYYGLCGAASRSLGEDWWLGLRDLRNELSHDYPDDSETVVERIAELIEKSQGLLTFWNEFRAKIEKDTISNA